MERAAKWLFPLMAVLLSGCSTHQFNQQMLEPVAAVPYSNLQVQVQFDQPDHSAYLANQLVSRLTKHRVNASILPSEATTDGNAQALLQLHLTEAWTETFISTRRKHRYSLTQMRGRIPRESPRFNSTATLVDLASGETVWQLEIHSAGAWYTEFPTQADALAGKLTQQLVHEGLIASGNREN